MSKVVQSLVKQWKEWGVEHVFGVPGKAVVPLILELGNQGIKYVLSRHECGAGFEAAGYALKKRSLGVAIGTSGPGGTNMLTAAGQAKAYHAPVLFITGHASMKDNGKPLGQDSTSFGTDLVQMFRSVTLFSERVERPELLETYLQHAIYKATVGVKGPVHLLIPQDVLLEETKSFSIPFPKMTNRTVSLVIPEAIEALSHAKRPVMFVGKGTHISEAYEEVQALAERFQIPVITTPGGKGAFATNHPLSIGPYGLGGCPEAAQYLRAGIDVMVAIGTKLSDMSIPGFTAQMMPELLIQFDVDPSFLGHAMPVRTLQLIGDAKQNLKHLLQLLPEAGLESSLYEVAAATEITEASHTKEPHQQITAEDVMKVLSKVLPEDSVLFGDDGSHSYHAIRHLEIKRPGSFRFDDVFACMGHAIGYAIGAKAAAPQDPVVCLTGDGCMFMHGTEISTAVNNGLNVIFIVLNNGRLDMVNKGMGAHTGRTDGTVFDIPMDVKQFAEALGCKALSTSTAEGFEEYLKSSLRSDAAVVIEVLVDPEEIPPTLDRG